jgi:ABC-type multidrug transport system fused ATPase/permease subunit
MKKTLKLFFNYYDKPKKNSLIFISFSICSSFLEVLTIFLFYNYVKYLSNGSINFYLDIINKLFFKYTQLNYFIFLSILLIFFYFIKLIISFSFSYWKNGFTQDIFNYYSNKLNQNYLSKNYKYFLSVNTSKIINNIFIETKNYAGSINFFLIFFSEFIIFISIIFFLLYKEFIITLYLLSFILVLSFIYKFFLKKIIINLGSLRFKSSSNFLKYIREIFDGIKTIKIYKKEHFFFLKAKKEIDIFSRNASLQGFFFDLPKLLIDFLIFIIIISLIFFYNFNKALVLDNAFTFALFIISFYKILPSMNRIINSYQNLIFFSPVSSVLEYEFLSLANKKQEKLFDNNLVNFHFKKNININNLVFNHKDQKKPFFDNLNLTINKNDCIGIFGSSGSGKSTLIDLIAGILNAENSYLTIDDYKIKSEKDISAWQNKIGYVSQSTFILNDTIRSNVAFGLNKYEINDDKVISVLKSVQLNNLLVRFNYDLNSLFDENGSNLSLGEKQRIGIARALYRGSEIYIFDEPTSSLDPENEDLFINFLEEFKKNKTIIMISHKKSNLRICNRIFEVKVNISDKNIISRKVLELSY